ncbi:hypothetical protein ACQKII_09220 [Lysinibacillus sp. NPDC048646]
MAPRKVSAETAINGIAEKPWQKRLIVSAMAKIHFMDFFSALP